MEALLTFCKSKIITIEPLLFFYAFARFMYIPAIQQYYYHYYGAAILEDTRFEFPKGAYCINSSLINYYAGSNDSYKKDETQSNHLVIYTNVLSSVPSVVTAILLGPLTDKYGRKLGLLAPCLGYFIEGLGSVLIIYFRLNPYYFIAANVFTGLTGGFTGLIAASFSYVADVGSKKWRSFRIAIIEAMMAFGKLAGQLSSGFWLSAVHCNFMPLMICYTGIMAANAIYALCIPESRTAEERKVLLQKTEGRLQKYSQAIKLYCASCTLTTYVLYVVTLILGVAILNMIGSFDLSVYFLKAIPFEFNSIQISYYQALRSVSQGLSSLLFFFFAMFNVKDSFIMLLGFLANGSGNLLTGLATRNWEIYTISGLQGMDMTVFPAARGLASKLINPEQQGALFSIIASVESLAAAIGSIIWSYIFPLTLNHNMKPGTTFLIISGLGFAMVPIILSVIFSEILCSSRKNQVSIQTGEISKDETDYSNRTTPVYVSDNDETSQLLPKKSIQDKGSINT